MKKEWEILMYTQAGCIVVTCLGIIIEFLYKADWGFVLINLGSLVFAATAKAEAWLLKHKKH